jgi:ribokinase
MPRKKILRQTPAASPAQPRGATPAAGGAARSVHGSPGAGSPALPPSPAALAPPTHAAPPAGAHAAARTYPVAVPPGHGAAPGHGARPGGSALGPLLPLSSAGPGKASTAGPKSGVAVVGSLNMDLVVRAETMPLPGQTVMGQDLLQNPGGKGGNQAAAVGRLWHRRSPGSKLVARIGDDVFGQNVLAALTAAKVDTASVLTTRHAPTGTAMILVDRHGENAIIVAGGANRHLSATDLLAQRKTIESSVVLLAQLETPADTVACGFALAKRSNVLTILDPAPAPPEGLPESLYHVDVLTPNQIEVQLLTGVAVRTIDDARRAAERFLARGTRVVVVKMGSQGAVIVCKGESGAGTTAVHVPGYRVPVVDTTGAGDAFAGALAVGFAEGMGLTEAVRFANAAGALACTKAGAMAAMPTRTEVEHLLSTGGK